MKVIAASFSLLLLISCSDQQRKIEDFEGDWEAPPMSEWFGIGISEQIEDLRNGTHPKARDLDDPKIKEMLSLSTEEAKAKLMESGVLEGASYLFDQGDPIIGFTISPPSKLTAYISINGERQSQEYEAEYELTSKEIVCRYEDELMILTISGDHLIVDNEKEGYPTKLKLSRASNGASKPE